MMLFRVVIDEARYPTGYAPITSADSVGDSIAAFCTALLAVIGGKKGVA